MWEVQKTELKSPTKNNAPPRRSLAFLGITFNSIRTEHWCGVFTKIHELYWAEKFEVFGTFDKMIHTSSTLSNILPSSPFFTDILLC